MITKQKPKRRHHHVWQLYLRPWTSGGAIWCLQNGRAFSTGTRDIAVEKDFYKFHRLTTADENFLQLMVAKSDPAAQRSFRALQDMLMYPFRMIDAIPGANKNKLIEKQVEEYASNVLEDLHSQVEARFIPLLNSALGGDVSFYGDERCIAFLDYLTKQYMRTKGIQERATAVRIPVEDVDIRRIWSILSFMLAQNIGGSLFNERKRRQLVLLKNATDVPFITGDQPVVNLQAKVSQTNSLTLFYPLSPTISLWLGEVDEKCQFPADGLTKEHVVSLNRKMAQASHQQIFANERAILESVIEFSNEKD